MLHRVLTTIRSRPLFAVSCAVMSLAVMSLAALWTMRSTATSEVPVGPSIRLLVARPADDVNGIVSVHLTDDGTTAFVSTKAELLPDLPPSDRFRVFAVDVATGTPRLVTDDWRVSPEAISGDGRVMLVTYHVDDSKEVPAILDTSTGQIIRRLFDEEGTVRDAVLSSDGSTAAFTFLFPDDDGYPLFAVDVGSSAIDYTLATVDGKLFDPQLSADGRVLAFSSYADNLPVGVGNTGSDAVVLDRSSGQMRFAYTTNDGDVPDDQSAVSGISADGSKVLIRSRASNLDGSARVDGGMSYFLFDSASGGTTRALPSDVTAASGSDKLSADGTHALVIRDQDTAVRLYALDGGSSVDVALSPSGEPANNRVTNFAHSTSMNADGTVVAFISQASNLGSDADDINDVFVWTATGSASPPQAAPATSVPVLATLPVPVETTAPQTTVPADSPLWADDPTATSFPAEALMSVDFTPELGIWPQELGPEAAIHALAPITDGWLAVGSLSPPLQPGTAALWRVAADGMFGEPETLPTVGGASSVARDVISVANTTLVAGYQGAGEHAAPVVWRDDGDGAWTYSVLATDPGRVRGAIVDEMLELADGTMVVIGRGDGPFHATVVLWWSSDGGVTWNDFIPAGARSFLPPLVASDGSLIAMLLSTVPGDDGLAAFDSATIVWDATGPRLESLQYIDPIPGERYWPRALLWDGTAFVGGFQTDGRPVFATSVDGVDYVVQDMALPGLSTSLPTNVEGMALVDGAITVFIEQGVEMTGFRREGADLVPIDLPYVVAGDMAYLEGHELLSTDGHRIGYVAANWASKVFLGWDGASWTTRQVTEVPPHRNLVRDEVREIATTGDSRAALLVRSVSDEPSHFQPGPSGIMWQPPGESEWMLPDIYAHIPVPSAVTEWRGMFIIAGLDFDTNTTTLWRLDPKRAVFTQMGVIDGRISELVGGADGVVAEVAAAGGPSESTKSLWQSSDGRTWTEVELPGSPTGLCTDGDRVVAVWMTSEGQTDIVGLTEVGADGVRPIGSPAQLDPYQIADGWHDSGRCGLNDRDIVSIHVGYEGALAELSPLSRSVPWTDGPNDPTGLTMNVTKIGSAEALVNDIAWTGKEWVTVGHGHDAESSMDALLWRSNDGLVWQPGETIAGGPGNQEAWSVVVEDGQLLIGGLDVQQGKIWVLPA